MDINSKITPFLFSKVFSISKKSRIFFFDSLGKSKNFKNFKIFNNIGSYDVLKKKNTKIGQNAANPDFFYSPCIYFYVRISVIVSFLAIFSHKKILKNNQLLFPKSTAVFMKYNVRLSVIVSLLALEIF